MFSSPYPDVDVPNLGIYDYLFGGLGEEDLDRIAIVDGVSGAETTYRSLRDQIDALAGAVAAQGLGVHGVAAILCPNIPAFATVFHGLLRAGATVTTINSHVYGGRHRQPAHRCGRGLALHRLGSAPGGPGGRRKDRDPCRAARGARRRRGPPLAGRLARRRRAGAPRLVRSRHPCGRVALLVRNHRPAQGRHAQPPESRCQRGTVPGAARRRPRGPAPGAAPVLPHLRADRAAEPRTAPAGPARHNAQVRSRPSSCGSSRRTGAATCSSPRRWPWRSPSTRWSPSTTSARCTPPFPAPPRWTGHSAPAWPNASDAGYCRATA